jgi:hypothetical protein
MSVQAACKQVHRASPEQVSTTGYAHFYEEPTALVAALDHSGNASLNRLSAQLVAAARSNDATSFNNALARAKSQCQALLE